jgi:pantoate--beta-alanine ligase
VIVESSVQETLQHVRTARRNGRIIGVVPTMGALHEGHVSLIERARSECDFVVATIFVNPTQFGPGEDFSRYPRTLDADLLMCRQAGADLVFTPSAASMYQSAAQTIVRVTELSKVLEGAHRPGHFDGVSTVVAKLFHITEPDLAYFGQKDYQQQLIIRRMVEDLDFSVKIVTCPIVREPDGLAMSSRNRYLSADERTLALRISQALNLAETLAAESDLSPPQVSEQMLHFLTASGEFQVGYAVVVDGQTLQNLQFRTADAVALIAVRVGTTRLIDNQILQFR